MGTDLMSSLLRNLLALVGGAIVAGMGIAVIETLGALAYPPPAGFDPANEAAMRAFIHSLPPAAFGYILAAYGVGTFGGVWVTTRFSVRRTTRQGWMLGLVFFAAGIINFLKYPHPVWFIAMALVLFPAATWVAVRLGRPRLRD